MFSVMVYLWCVPGMFHVMNNDVHLAGSRYVFFVRYIWWVPGMFYVMMCT